MQQHRPSGDGMEDFVAIRLHPRALAGGKDHDGNRSSADR